VGVCVCVCVCVHVSYCSCPSIARDAQIERTCIKGRMHTIDVLPTFHQSFFFSAAFHSSQFLVPGVAHAQRVTTCSCTKSDHVLMHRE